jgi:hypothetical protein
MVSPMDEADVRSGGLGKLSLIVCHADFDSASPSPVSSLLSPVATRDCGGASCSPGLPAFFSLILSSASPAEVEASRFWFPDIMVGAHEDHAEGASRWTGRSTVNGEDVVER